MNRCIEAENNSGGWIGDNVKCYRQSNEDVFSIYVGTDDPRMNSEDAEELLSSYNIEDYEYIEMDESVANEIGFDYCFVFHVE